MTSQRSILRHGSKHTNKNPDKENIYQNRNNNSEDDCIFVIFFIQQKFNRLRMRRMNSEMVDSRLTDLPRGEQAIAIGHGSLDSRRWQ